MSCECRRDAFGMILNYLLQRNEIDACTEHAALIDKQDTHWSIGASCSFKSEEPIHFALLIFKTKLVCFFPILRHFDLVVQLMDSACSFGLRYEARAVNAVLGEPDEHLFWAATCSINQVNELHLLQYNEDQRSVQGKAVYTLKEGAPFIALHPSPTDPALLFASTSKTKHSLVCNQVALVKATASTEDDQTEAETIPNDVFDEQTIENELDDVFRERRVLQSGKTPLDVLFELETETEFKS